jgi:hypothetical protein
LGRYALVQYQLQYGDPPWAWLIGNGLTGGLGGAASALILALHFGRDVWSRPSVAIGAGWLVAFVAPTAVLFWLLYASSMSELTIALLAMALNGAIGTDVMLRQFASD